LSHPIVCEQVTLSKRESASVTSVDDPEKSAAGPFASCAITELVVEIATIATTKKWPRKPPPIAPSLSIKQRNEL
jgi:hypothetical protein